MLSDDENQHLEGEDTLWIDLESQNTVCPNVNIAPYFVCENVSYP